MKMQYCHALPPAAARAHGRFYSATPSCRGKNSASRRQVFGHGGARVHCPRFPGRNTSLPARPPEPQLIERCDPAIRKSSVLFYLTLQRTPCRQLSVRLFCRDVAVTMFVLKDDQHPVGPEPRRVPAADIPCPTETRPFGAGIVARPRPDSFAEPGRRAVGFCRFFGR